MKIYIGPYTSWIGPYQIAEKLLFWMDKDADGRVHKFGTWLGEKKDGSDTVLTKFCNWVQSKKSRKIKIRIDNYDYWNAHNTASLILEPLFKKLRDAKHGSGFIDDEDVPDELKSTSAKPLTEEEEKQCYSDNNLHARYEWVLNEIIWALEQDNSDWEDQFWKTHPEIDFTDYPEDEGKLLIPVRLKVKGDCDWEGRKAYQERINRGFKLMGKYWQTLWD